MNNKDRNSVKVQDTVAKTCVIYNYAQHYRLAIFQKLDAEIGCDFYFGNKMKDVKKLNYALLPGFKRELNNVKIFSHIYWQQGAVGLLWKGYFRFIILGEYYCLSTWMILILSKFTNKKIYLWTHGWYGNETFIKRIIKKIFFNLSDHIFLYGDYAKQLMIKEGFKAARMNVIHNSLNYSEQIDIRKQLVSNHIYRNHFKDDNPVVIFIGRLTKEKRLPILLKAIEILNRENSQINIVFVGSGEEESTLREIVNNMYNVNCWFFGPTYDELTISNLIYNAAVCVSPGNVGLTAIHSMMYGTPVITHNYFPLQMPEFEAVIPGKTGDFFIEDNEEDLACVIKKWTSPEILRVEVRKACYQVIDERYNPTYQISVFKKVMVGEPV